MKILVSNDDGYLATGINVLTEALARVADVVVFAPDRNRSAASNSLTVHMPLRVQKIAENRYCVDGTPSDCVHLALTGFLDYEPDLVVSGIFDSEIVWERGGAFAWLETVQAIGRRPVEGGERS